MQYNTGVDVKGMSQEATYAEKGNQRDRETDHQTAQEESSPSEEALQH